MIRAPFLADTRLVRLVSYFNTWPKTSQAVRTLGEYPGTSKLVTVGEKKFMFLFVICMTGINLETKERKQKEEEERK